MVMVAVVGVLVTMQNCGRRRHQQEALDGPACCGPAKLTTATSGRVLSALEVFWYWWFWCWYWHDEAYQYGKVIMTRDCGRAARVLVDDTRAVVVVGGGRRG